MSELIGVEVALVRSMLTQRVVKTVTEAYTKKLGVQDAKLTRDAIVKTLYEVITRFCLWPIVWGNY